ncbi:DUF726 domain-containing protein [Thorsellia kenyensis]|uniref:DUF726 domain-containing protein n=1 Tax=Thorsellia kenyensis TaxID=1549888 RepID=A0ABV6CB72_9GAMM
MLKKIKAQFLVNESQDIIISDINTASDLPINVYIHGYGSFYLKTSEQDFKNRINQISGYEHILVRWPSEHYNKAIIEGLTKGLALNQLRNLKSTTSKLSQISGPLLVIGIEALTQIKKVQNKTHHLDTVFAERLNQFMLMHKKANRPINFVAHSFGTRLLLNALMNKNNRSLFNALNLHNIVLMGGAIDRDAVSWQDVLGQIRGNIYNCYSKKDWALAVKPDFDKNIGRYPVVLKDEYAGRIINQEMKDIDHKSYWRKLDDVLARLDLTNER